MSSASSQDTGAKRPSPLAPMRRSGVCRRPGPCTHSGYEPATLVQITPAVYGLAREPRIFTIFACSTVTVRLQVSGQSRGQTLAWSLMGDHRKTTCSRVPDVRLEFRFELAEFHRSAIFPLRKRGGE